MFRQRLNKMMSAKVSSTGFILVLFDTNVPFSKTFEDVSIIPTTYPRISTQFRDMWSSRCIFDKGKWVFVVDVGDRLWIGYLVVQLLSSRRSVGLLGSFCALLGCTGLVPGRLALFVSFSIFGLLSALFVLGILA